MAYDVEAHDAHRHPHTWPAVCPVCQAAPDKPCRSSNGYVLPEVHATRLQGEYGQWCDTYDALYRDERLRFELRPYGRMLP